jgi:hypothetical protein
MAQTEFARVANDIRAADAIKAIKRDFRRNL